MTGKAALSICLLLGLIAQRQAKAQVDEPQGWSVAPVPVLAYAPETGLLLGAAAIVSYQPENLNVRPTSIKLVAAYSTKGRAQAEFHVCSFQLNDRLFWRSRVEMFREPGKYYGIGNTTQLADEESYRANRMIIELSPMYAPFESVPHFYVGPLAGFNSLALLQFKTGGLIDSLDVSEGRDLGLGLGAKVDTRDSVINPSGGFLVSLEVESHSKARGSDFSYSLAKAEGRRYFAVRPTHTLALATRIEARNGEPPFFNLAEFGGQTSVRGHFRGRYRDRCLSLAQAEYRMQLWWPLGLVLFAGAGDVAHSPNQLFNHGIKFGTGAGLRVMLDRKARVNVTADVAWGNDQSGFYLDLGETF